MLHLVDLALLALTLSARFIAYAATAPSVELLPCVFLPVLLVPALLIVALLADEPPPPWPRTGPTAGGLNGTHRGAGGGRRSRRLGPRP